ncbi:MAG: hypothetical protein IJV97_04350 [Alphaproteobacteria bacterium]|nr:hypothetical protein [Alphaproteobacteria bacterium]
MKITVNDKMQKNYDYETVCEMGQGFADDFKPDLTPKEMLAMGVFEGHYISDCKSEFPKDWFMNAKISEQKPDVNCNYFKIKSRQSLQEWQRKGWIYQPDPRGWFQWYCRYYMGRRISGLDDLQIKRWKAFKRHLAQVEQNCMPFDLDCRKRQRQALLQWAYNPFF